MFVSKKDFEEEYEIFKKFGISKLETEGFFEFYEDVWFNNKVKGKKTYVLNLGEKDNKNE